MCAGFGWHTVNFLHDSRYGVWFGFVLETAWVTWGCCSYCWAKCLGGFHNMLSVLQVPSPPGASGLWASGYGYTNTPGWEKQGCGLTVPQFLYGDCPPACPTVSFSAMHWGELLCICAGKRIWLGSWGRSGAALCLHTLSCPQELVCVPMPSGRKRTAVFPWKTARCHKGKLGGSGELTSSADCWEDRPQTVRKFRVPFLTCLEIWSWLFSSETSLDWNLPGCFCQLQFLVWNCVL